MSKRRTTEQLNLRIPVDLIEDIEEISKILKVNKSEWIKIKLSEIVFEEKNRIKNQNTIKNNKSIK